MFPENVQTLNVLQLKMCPLSIVLRMSNAFGLMFSHSFTVMLSLKILLAANSDYFFAFFYVNSINNFLTECLWNFMGFFLWVFLALLVLPGLTLWPSVVSVMVLLFNTVRISSLNSYRCLSSTFSVVAIIVVMFFIFINNLGVMTNFMGCFVNLSFFFNTCCYFNMFTLLYISNINNHIVLYMALLVCFMFWFLATLVVLVIVTIRTTGVTLPICHLTLV